MTLQTLIEEVTAALKLLAEGCSVSFDKQPGEELRMTIRVDGDAQPPRKEDR